MKYSTVYNALTKRASARSDFLASILYTPVLSQFGGAGGVAAGGTTAALQGTNRLGGYVGLGSDPATEEEEEQMDLNPSAVMLPGVATQRVDRRMKRQLLDNNLNTPHFWSQKLSPASIALLLAALGAGGGYAVGKLSGNSGGFEAAIGGLGGLGAAALTGLGGLAAAGLTPTRTKEEQRAYANSSVLPEYLIPGVAAYNEAKTIGRMFSDSDARAKKRLQKELEK